MAGDWIKMRLDLQSHPKIVRILSTTKSDKFRVIGGLHAVWAVFDTHSIDGRLDGYTPEALDHIIGWPGFAGAVIAVGWLAVDGPETLILPEFDEHNGKSGKRRAEDQKRKRGERKSENCPQNVRKMSNQKSDGIGSREEKRREDIKEHKPTSVQSPDEPGDRQDDEKETKPRKHHGTEEDHKAARWIFDQVRKVDATAKEPNWDGWANDVRLMREIDGRTHHDICELFGWASKDKFWCTNILSPSKLREKWGQLAAKRAVGAADAQQGQKFQFSGVDRSGDARAQAATMARHGLTVPDGEVEF